MAKAKKPKTKQSTFDTLCTEVSLGVWEWVSQGFRWRYHQGGLGLNLFMVTGEKANSVAFFKNLDTAVGYSWGFTHGFNEGGKNAKNPPPANDEDE